MKKLLSLILVAALFIGISCIPAAHAVSPAYQHSDPGASVLTPEPLKELLGASTIDRVEYSYTLTPVEENPDSMLVTLDFVLYVGGQPYYASATGDIDRYELPSGKVLWEGPAEGAIRVNGVEHFLMAGFAKLDGQEAVQISLTIQPQLGEKLIDPILISFGGTVFTAEVSNEVQSMAKDVTASVSEPAEIQTELPNFASSPLDLTLPIHPYDPPGGLPSLGPNGEWKFQEMALSYFKADCFDGYALQARAYFYPGPNDLVITTSSYCDNIENYYNSIPLQYAMTTVAAFTVALECHADEPDNAAHIVGLKRHKFQSSNLGKKGQSLAPLFYDAMNCLGIPTNTIEALVGELTGCVTTSTQEMNYADYCSLTVEFGEYEYADFDDNALSVPIVFRLCRTPQSGYTKSSPFTATVQLTYRTMLTSLIDDSGAPFYAKTSAQDAVMNLELYLL